MCQRYNREAPRRLMNSGSKNVISVNEEADFALGCLLDAYIQSVLQQRKPPPDAERDGQCVAER